MDAAKRAADGAASPRLPAATSPVRLPSRRWAWAAFALVLLAGALVRLATWDRALGGAEAQLLGDTDPHYHVLRAHLILTEWPRAVELDPGLNHPHGARIPWPPLFDQLLAAAASAAGADTLEAVARAAVFVPVAIALLAIALAALAARALAGPGCGIGAALLVALLPASVDYGVLGRADQHVLEMALLAAAVPLLAAGGTARTRGRRLAAAFALGAVLALGLWNWLGAPLYLLVLASLAGAWHVLAPAKDGSGRRLASGLAVASGLAALLLVGVVLAFGGPGAMSRLDLLGLSALQPSLCALVAAFAGLLALPRAPRQAGPGSPRGESVGAVASPAAGDQRRGEGPHPLRGLAGRRAAEVLAAGALPLAAALAFEPFRHEAVRGVVALVAGNPWYRSIDEFQPLLGSRYGLWRDAQFALASFGLALPAAALSVVALARAAWHAREDRLPRAILVLWTFAFLALTLASRRFALYLVVPLGAAVAFGVARAADAAARRWPRLGTFSGRLVAQGALYALLLAPALPFLLLGESGHQPVRRDVQEQLRWLAARPAPPGREGVLCQWTLGHAVRYFARRPVVASPFGTEGGAGAMEDTAAFFLARDEGVAEELLRARRVGHVVLANPVNDWLTLAPFLAEAPAVVRVGGGIVEFLPGVEDVVTARLFFADGGSTRGAPGLGGFRLVHETRGIDLVDPLRDERVKLFEVVAGARLAVRGLTPGSRAVARVAVTTAAGRTFAFETWGIADREGAVQLRVPYATGENGASRAGECEVAAEGRVARAAVPEAAVRSGGAVDVDLASEAGGRR